MFKILAASFITGRSESEPIMIPTRGETAKQIIKQHERKLHASEFRRIKEDDCE